MLLYFLVMCVCFNSNSRHVIRVEHQNDEYVSIIISYFSGYGGGGGNDSFGGYQGADDGGFQGFGGER